MAPGIPRFLVWDMLAAVLTAFGLAQRSHGPRGICMFFLCLFLVPVLSYTPALPTNDSYLINNSSNDKIELTWASAGFFSADVSRQLVSDTYFRGVARGAFVHFSERNASNNPTTSSPWLAFVSCDYNETDASRVDDIFTLCRDHGAVAAVLYSLTSEACIINNEYIENFEKPIDVYSTVMLQTARLIDNQFSNVGSEARWFDSKMLNGSADGIWKFLNDTPSPTLLDPPNPPTPTETEPTESANDGEDPADESDYYSSDDGEDGFDLSNDDEPFYEETSVDTATNYGPWDSSQALKIRRKPSSVSRDASPTQVEGLLKKRTTSSSPSFSTLVPSSVPSDDSTVYLIAQVAPANATIGVSTANDNDENSNQNNNGGANTGLAMIILYAITGCVTLLFLIIILSGAVRAIRHPERYGPRAANPNGPFGDRAAQSRRQGLTRAILDTFPVVKFNNTSATRRTDEGGEEFPKPPDVERVELGEMASQQSPRSDQDAEWRPTTTERSSSLVHRSDQVMRNTANQSFGENVDNLSDNEDAAAALRWSATHDGAELQPSTSRQAETTQENDNAMLDLISFDDSVTCPICVEEWNDGDDVRILPCDRRHRFHRECIDPWLLNVSSLCPLCRLDLRTTSLARHEARDTEHADNMSEEDLGSQTSSEERNHHRLSGHSFFNGTSTNIRARMRGRASSPSAGNHDGATELDHNTSTQPSNSNQQSQHGEQRRFAKYLDMVRSAKKKALGRPTGMEANAEHNDPRRDGDRPARRSSIGSNTAGSPSVLWAHF